MVIAMLVLPEGALGQDEFVGLGIYMQVPQLNYAARQMEGDTYFVGEPVELVVFIRNNTRRAITLGAPGRDWRGGLSVSIDADNLSNADFTTTWIPAPRAAALPLLPFDMVRSTMKVQCRGSDDFPLGRYRIRVAVSEEAINRPRTQFNDRLSDERWFEFRIAVSREEQLDLHFHLAYRARLTGDIDRQESEVRKVLALHHASAPAHAQLGEILRRRSDCNGARTELETALKLAISNGDPLLHMATVDREDWAAGLRGAIPKCR